MRLEKRLPSGTSECVARVSLPFVDDIPWSQRYLVFDISVVSACHWAEHKVEEYATNII